MRKRARATIAKLQAIVANEELTAEQEEQWDGVLRHVRRTYSKVRTEDKDSLDAVERVAEFLWRIYRR